jgi:protein-tyrosine phosphatase
MNRYLTKLPYGLPGEVYRSSLPFSPLFDPKGRVLDAYHDAGIEVVVMLNEVEEVFSLIGFDLRNHYEALGFRVIHSPIPDFSIPSQDSLAETLLQTLNAARARERVVIHCHAGSGRTGVLAACLARVVFDLEGEEAVRWVRQFVPTAVENALQYQFVLDFEWNRDADQC